MRGFTLIELLVTLSIIVILSLVGFVTFREVLQGARDGKRQVDLKAIQSALEQYRSDLTFYPIETATNTLLTNGGVFSSNTGLGSGTAPATAKTYLNQVPLDPFAPATKYCYTALPANCDNSVNNKCTSYYLNTKLEKTTGSFTCNGVNNYSLQVTPP